MTGEQGSPAGTTPTTAVMPVEVVAGDTAQARSLREISRSSLS